MAEVAQEAVWATSFDFDPDFKAFYVENVVAFTGETLYALVSFEILEADVATTVTHVTITLKEDDCLNFAEVLIVVLPNLLQGLWHLSVLSDDVLLVLNVVDDPTLHQEYPILV